MNSQDIARPRVLVCDDDPVARTIIAGILSTLNVEVIEAGSGQEALDRAAGTHIDLVLLDLMMPGMDGLETVQRLRADPTLQALPVVMLTAYGDRSARLAALTAGADDFLSKPVDRAELRARVSGILRADRSRRIAEAYEGTDQFIERAPIGVAVLGVDGRLLTRNERAADLLPPDGPFADGFVAHHRARIAQAIAAIAEGGTTPAPVAAVCAPPALRELDIALAPLRWRGQPAIVAFLTDVTEARDFAARWRAQEHQTNTITAAAGIAHDLAGLMHVALMQLDVGRDAATPVAARSDALADLTATLEGAQPLLGDLRALARPLDTSAPDAGRGDAAAALRTIARRGRYLLPGGVSIGLELSTDRCHVPVATHALEEVLLNLIANARDALGTDGQIVLALERSPDQVTLSVRDSGPGFPTELQDRIGEAFVTTKPEGQGTGLGLWRAGRICAEAGGVMTLGRAPEGGAQVDLRLPRLPD